MGDCSGGNCSSGSCSSGSCSSGSCSGDDDRLPPGMLARYNLNLDTGLGTLVWAETVGEGDEAKIHPAVFEVLGKVRDVSEDRIFAMIVGGVSLKPLYKELFEHGVDTIYHIRCKEMEEYIPDAYARAFADLSERINPMMILNADTERGREVSELTSDILKTDLFSGCTDIILKGAEFAVKRDMMLSFGKKHPYMATLRTGMFAPKAPAEGRTGTAISRPFKI